MDDEETLYPVDNVANNEEEEEAIELERRATRVQIFTCSAVDVAETSDVRPNLTTFDSSNVRIWVIPEAQSYSFGIGGSKNAVQEEHISMIYKGLQQQDGRLMRPKDIIADMKTMYGIQILYRFWRCMRPVIAIDGTHLKGRFRGTIFVTTAQDENEQVYPIAFWYGELENNLSWEWFLDCLKAVQDHIDDLVFISDWHASIEARISKVFPDATHMICC
ncbi:hypothetical protein Ddye_008229 [Dipteronia dyeriana]|uniref:MULE transposase domain-containing protein n=1 Tax=Dipteronia dyeriana TaxID=168575 RepID=A0AAD9X9F5_9ROSI|nr:hypothetical protein Ddye_008229 [Dipteronia dyeriana]